MDKDLSEYIEIVPCSYATYGTPEEPEETPSWTPKVVIQLHSGGSINFQEFFWDKDFSSEKEANDYILGWAAKKYPNARISKKFLEAR
jgi:hypothetical protein